MIPGINHTDNFTQLPLKQVQLARYCILFLSLSPLSLFSARAQDYIQYPLQAAVAIADSVLEPRQMFFAAVLHVLCSEFR